MVLSVATSQETLDREGMLGGKNSLSRPHHFIVCPVIRPTGGSTEQVSVALKLVQVASEIVMSEKDWCWNFVGFSLLYVQLNDDGRRNGESQMNGRIRIRGVPSERCDAH